MLKYDPKKCHIHPAKHDWRDDVGAEAESHTV